ncbi:metal-binding protein [Pseudoflavonifractor sp. 60]|uniref:cysteine-rich small domain-containing protein n=1 Tax=Pseudoflavonifractor sp. 60 TaxID=2304576 RepID=UPI00136B4950|nr:cysteine-rich small domain-containing protein [Pseudoflavonifractor sp. 60]NBI68375.1 metal-binding protein [Pseudoflavonifractor sp. 60]
MTNKANRYPFFQHQDCEFFPCHETDQPEDFNCLFCYCPLYTLGSACGGSCTWLPDGTKDCSSCLLPHTRRSCDYIASKFKALSDLAKMNR